LSEASESKGNILFVIDKTHQNVTSTPTPGRSIMKTIKATAITSLMLASLAAQAGQPIINLNIGGELAPGVYGQVQFGNSPPPPVLYAQPRVIVRQPDEDRMEPMYMHVPPRHAKNWRRYCREYNACGRRVFFVRSEEYEPGYREGRGKKHRNEGDRGDRGDKHRD
jgi:hypothetical protein